MIDIHEVVADPDMTAPQSFTVLRSIGAWVGGGFLSTTASLSAIGPVQRASDKEIDMMPEADRITGGMNFWWTQPIYVTRNKQGTFSSAPGTVPQGLRPGVVFTLTDSPQGGALYKNGQFMTPGLDYTTIGAQLTMTVPVALTDTLFFTWAQNNIVQPAASDILVYHGEQYRVMGVKHYTGSGYWRATAQRMRAT